MRSPLAINLTNLQPIDAMSIFGNDPKEPKPSSEKPLKQIIFVQIQDSECDVIGWRYQEIHCGDYGISFSSNRLFDSFDETLAAWQESRRSEP